MTKTPYHDSSNYVADEYDDDFDLDPSKESNKETIQISNLNDEESKKDIELNKKLIHKTDTKEYNSFEFDIMSPENANADSEKIFTFSTPDLELSVSEEYADPVIAQAVTQIESKVNRKITHDEFDKLCKTYASVLANRDAWLRDMEAPNPIDYKMYYDTLIQNKKIKPAFEMRMSKLEDQMVGEIDRLMEAHKNFDYRDLHVNKGTPVNVRHKGKVCIRDEEHNQEIKIDNKKDVDLLRMKYRKDWLDKKHERDINDELNGNHSNDGFE